MRNLFMQTARLAFGHWRPGDEILATRLWGDAAVTRHIVAGGVFSPADIAARLARELENEALYSVQYWPVFEKDGGAFVGCCGLRPYAPEPGRPPAPEVLEFGVHLCSAHWGKGYGYEAGRAVVEHAAGPLGAKSLFAGHHPDNRASAVLLAKLGFAYTHEEYYPPTGLYHPGYKLPLKGLALPGTGRGGR